MNHGLVIIRIRSPDIGADEDAGFGAALCIGKLKKTTGEEKEIIFWKNVDDGIFYVVL